MVGLFSFMRWLLATGKELPCQRFYQMKMGRTEASYQSCIVAVIHAAERDNTARSQGRGQQPVSSIWNGST